MRIYFVRHAQGTHNLGGDAAYYDPANEDAPLTEIGLAQVRNTAEALGKEVEKFDHIFTSSLTRCLQTAEVIYREVPSRKPIVTDFLLEAQGGGHICNQRRSMETLESKFPEFEFAIPGESTYHYTMPREDDAAIRKRVDFIVDLASKMGGENVLMVSHHDTIYAYTGQSLRNADYCVVELANLS